MKIRRIGVIGAMHQEIALLHRDMEHVNKETVGTGKGARTYSRGRLHGKDAPRPSRSRRARWRGGP